MHVGVGWSVDRGELRHAVVWGCAAAWGRWWGWQGGGCRIPSYRVAEEGPEPLPTSRPATRLLLLPSHASLPPTLQAPVHPAAPTAPHPPTAIRMCPL